MQQKMSQALFGTAEVNGKGLAFFRIFLAAILLFDFFFDLLPAWDDLLGTQIYSAGFVDRNIFWYLLPENIYLQYFVLAIYAIFLFLLLVGWRARLAAFGAFVIYASIISHNILIISNADVLARVLLLWTSFLPISRHFSLDAILQGGVKQEKQWPLLPVLAIKVQIAVIYFCSGMFKLAGEPWLSGKAIQYSLSDDIYGSALGVQLAGLMPEAVLFVLTWSLILFQLVFSLLVYAPGLKKYTLGVALIGAGIMHISFIFLMKINIFPFVCLAYLFILVPDAWLERFTAKLHFSAGGLRKFFPTSTEREPNVFVQGVSGVLMLVMLAYTLMILPQSPVRPPEALSMIARNTGVEQRWSIFAPETLAYIRDFSIAGVNREGQAVDVSSILSRQYVRNSQGYYIFSNRRWSRLHLLFVGTPGVAEGYGRWICDQDKEIAELKFDFSERHRFKAEQSWRKTITYRCS
jgi:hypothetical protein